MIRLTALSQEVDGIIKHCGLCAASDHYIINVHKFKM